jgi:ribosome biogenesis GTPase A
MMHIQWYPGHMTRAKREMQAMLERVDMVIEIRDARLPLASKNPMIDEIIQQKPRLIVLNKRDMADSKATSAWIKHLQYEGVVVELDALHDDVRKLIVEACLLVMRPKFERWKARGIQPRRIKAMITGIPNVGKSTLINQLAKKKIMVTADRPGVTMALKWANVHPQLDILDTPGILWPKFDDQSIAIKLALSGAIKESILSTQELAYTAFDFMLKRYPCSIEKRYEIHVTEVKDFFDQVQEKRKLQSLHQAYDVFLREIKQGLLGPISFEYVEDLD